ncbi:MAG: alpha/beta fold hydrolase [Actinomycetales bacterium]|nr:alpha/beta fold hydrolase [Actinomycetales bacterium]
MPTAQRNFDLLWKVRWAAALAVIAAVSVAILVVRRPDATSTSAPKVQLGGIGFAQCDADPDDVPSVDANVESERLHLTRAGRHHSFCGKISTADERTIDIAVSTDRDAVELGTKGLRGRTVVFWHPGGPGISPVTELRRAGELLDTSRFAVVAWDGQTASKSAGACGAVSLRFGVGRPRSVLTDGGLARAVARECIQAKAAPGATSGSAKGESEDLEQVRGALDVAAVHMWANSFGAAVLQYYAAAHPERLAASVLVSPFLEGIDPVQRATEMSKAMTHVESQWARDCMKICRTKLAVAASGGWNSLARFILRSHPRVGSSTRRLSPTEFDQAMVSASRSADSMRKLAPMFDLAIHGDGSLLAQVSETYFFGVDRSKYYEVLCTSFGWRRDLFGKFERVSQSSSVRAIVSEFAPCSFQAIRRPTVPLVPASAARKLTLFVGESDVLSPPAVLRHVGWTQFATQCVMKSGVHSPVMNERLIEAISKALSGADSPHERSHRLCEMRRVHG